MGIFIECPFNKKISADCNKCKWYNKLFNCLCSDNNPFVYVYHLFCENPALRLVATISLTTSICIILFL